MLTYIANLTQPPATEVALVEEVTAIVLASSEEDARTCFEEYLIKRSLRDWSVTIADKRPTAEFLASANLKPRIVALYNP